MSPSEFPLHKNLGVRFLRIFYLTIQGFTKSQVQSGSAILTYYSLLGLVPFLAFLIGIAKVFHLETSLLKWVSDNFSTQKLISSELLPLAEDTLKLGTHGIISAFILLFFLWSIMKIFIHLEISLNSLWEVKRSRPLFKKLRNFSLLMILCPLLTFVVYLLNVYLTTQVEGVLPFYIFNIFPYLLTAVLFSFLYYYIPNTIVRLKPAIYAGLVAAAFFQVFHWAYLYFQIGVAQYNLIYGVFAAVPLFLIWAHLSWLIFLLGGKIAFAFQNSEAYEFAVKEMTLSSHFKKHLRLRIVFLSMQKQRDGKPPLSAVEISKELHLPQELVLQQLYSLCQAKILKEVEKKREFGTGYVPDFESDDLTIKDLLDMMEGTGGHMILPPSRHDALIAKTLEEFNDLVKKSDANVYLKDI